MGIALELGHVITPQGHGELAFASHNQVHLRKKKKAATTWRAAATQFDQVSTPAINLKCQFLSGASCAAEQLTTLSLRSIRAMMVCAHGTDDSRNLQRANCQVRHRVWPQRRPARPEP